MAAENDLLRIELDDLKGRIRMADGPYTGLAFWHATRLTYRDMAAVLDDRNPADMAEARVPEQTTSGWWDKRA